MGMALLKCATTYWPHITVAFIAVRASQMYEEVNGIPSILFMMQELLNKHVLQQYTSSSSIVRTAVEDAIGLFLIFHLLKLLQAGFKVWRNASIYNVIESIKTKSYNVLLHVPVISGKIKDELKSEKLKLEKSLDKSLKQELVGIKRNTSLPSYGTSDTELLELMEDFNKTDMPKWNTGKVSGAVYHGDNKGHWELLSKAYHLFSVSNPLHPDIWPSVMKFDAEVCSMTASMLNGGDTNVVGASTSGGTESILLSLKTHRERARKIKGIYEPEIIAPVTAHAAFDKACELLNIILIHVPVDPNTFMVDPKKVKRLITSNTIMLVGSAPQFPHGIIDPIKELGKLASRYDIGLHVDCCLGGFVLPFAKKLGYDIPDFDFSVKGVTAISVDTHKYGYASKGTSVVLYRNKDLRKYQYFAYPKWTGGLYITPGTAGSRSGALIACAWAALMRIGENGYLQMTKDIIETMMKIRAGIEKIPGLVVLGDPKAMIVAFDAVDVNVVCISDKMKHKHGWSLNVLQRPICVHICVTQCTVGHALDFLRDLESVYEEVKLDPAAAAKEGNAPIYGMASSLPSGPVDEILQTYTDCVLQG